MILSDISKRVIKADTINDIIAIFEKAMYGKNEIYVRVGEFEKEVCYEIEIIYPVGDSYKKI
ncbi:hypothetical protein [Clostridium perfringens]|uniref:hypothetical protein n=1 Tax=Clostridium perfringens TaxID=1502 RepID=UPI00096A465D|nr:hypothetical protein [Clostridium perfringens]